MTNADLIERLRNAATFGTCLEAADAIAAADKRIAELEQVNCSRLDEAERKLAVAREALKQIPHALGHDFYAAATTIADEALAQIGGEDASS